MNLRSMKKVVLLLCTLLLFIQQGMAQVGTKEVDTELWFKAGVDFKLAPKWEVSAEEQLRFDNNIGEIKNFHTELGLKFDVTDQLDLRFATRFISRKTNNAETSFNQLFRYQVGAAYKHRWNQIEFKHRAVFQNRNDPELSEMQGDIPERYFRWRTGMEYKIKDWKYDPIFRVEYFGALNGTQAGTDDTIRFDFGTERKYDGIGEFGFFYRYETTLNAIDTSIAHIINFRYAYSF